MLSIAAVAASLLCCCALLLNDRRSRAMINELESHINDLSTELQGLSNASMGIGRKLQVLEKDSERLNGKVTEIQKNDPTTVSYSEAARLVGMGANVDELMNACGISRPEAELVLALTKKQEQEVPVLREDA
jgi:uncharacterized protein YoxC